MTEEKKIRALLNRAYDECRRSMLDDMEELKKKLAGHKKREVAVSALTEDIQDLTSNQKEHLAELKKSLDACAKEMRALVSVLKKENKTGKLAARIVKYFFENQDTDVFCQKALDDLIATTRSKKGFIVLFREAPDEVQVLAARDDQARNLEYRSFTISRSVLNDIRKNRETILVDNVQNGKSYSDETSIMEGGVTSIFVVPLIYQKMLIGALYIENLSRLGLFAEIDRELLEEFGAILAAPLHYTAKLRDVPLSGDDYAEFHSKYDLGGIRGKSEGLMKVLKIVIQVADQDVPVHIRGESGTGKELIAKALHNNSARQNKPFVCVNCSDFDSSLLNAQLHGYVKGAYTGAVMPYQGFFEQANEGTLFLDEIADMSADLQAKLLRVLESKKIQRLGSNEEISVDFRLITATNCDLEEAKEKQKFRKDLYYRILGVRLDLPPLRERKEDIPLLINHFADAYGKKRGITDIKIDQDVYRLLENYDFEGNIRELERIIEAAVARLDGDRITADILPARIVESDSPVMNITKNPYTRMLKLNPTNARELKRCKEDMKNIGREHLRIVEAKFVRQALNNSSGNIKKAADQCGMHRVQFHKLKRETEELRKKLFGGQNSG